MRFLLLLLALLPVAAVAQIETPGTGGGGGGGGGTSTPYYGPFTNLTAYGTASNKSLFISPLATTATGIVVKAVASQSADLFIAETSTGAKQFALRSDGSIEYNNAVISYVGGNGAVRWGGGGQSFAGYAGLGAVANPSSPLVYLYPDAAATLQLGADAVTATAQIIKAHDGSGTDKAGADFTLAGGQNTGGGVGGALMTKTSLPGSGSGLGSLGTRHYAYAGQKALTDNVTGNLFDVSIPTSKYASVRVFVSIKANDGFGGWSVNTIEKNFSAYNDAGTVVVGASADTTSVAHAAVGTETVAVSGVSTGGNMLRIQAVFISDGWAEVPSSIVVRWQIWINSDDIATVTPL